MTYLLRPCLRRAEEERVVDEAVHLVAHGVRPMEPVGEHQVEGACGYVGWRCGLYSSSLWGCSLCTHRLAGVVVEVEGTEAALAPHTRQLRPAVRQKGVSFHVVELVAGMHAAAAECTQLTSICICIWVPAVHPVSVTAGAQAEAEGGARRCDLCLAPVASTVPVRILNVEGGERGVTQVGGLSLEGFRVRVGVGVGVGVRVRVRVVRLGSRLVTQVGAPASRMP